MSNRTAPRLLLALLLASTALALVAAPASAAASSDDPTGFSVAPLRIDVEKGTATTSIHEITIRNTNPTSARFTFSKEDFEGDQSDPDATPKLLGGRYESPISGYDWLSGFPRALTIPAGESRTIDVKVIIPPGASGGHYTALMIAGPAHDIGNAHARSRVGVLFLMDAGGVPPPEIVITEITDTVGGGTTVIYENGGDTAVQPGEDTTMILDPVGPGGDTIEVEPTDCSLALPGGTGKCEFDTGVGEASDENGRPYAGSVTLVGNEKGSRASAELPTEWAGSWSSMLLPLVGLALFVLYFVFLRRRRRQEDEPEVMA